MDFNEDWTSLEAKLLEDAASKRLPINGSLELTPLCNMNCDMCYVHLTPQEMKPLGRIRTVEEWLEIGKQMQKAGVLFLLLTGGEPLLYPGFRELYCGLKKLGMILTVNTNGTMLDEEWADFFCRNKPRRINITLYGANESTYEKLCHRSSGYEETLKAIRLLRDRHVDVKISGSMTKANAADLNGVFEIGEQMEVPVRIDTYMMPAARERGNSFSFETRLSPEDAAKSRRISLKREMGEPLFSEYRDRKLWETEHILPETEPKHMSCRAGKCSFTINWQGKMRPCVIMSEPSISVLEHGFAKAWEHIAAETGKIVLSSKCNSCHLRPVCRTCAACALLEGGSYGAVPEYMCRYAKTSLEELRRDREEAEKRESASHTEGKKRKDKTAMTNIKTNIKKQGDDEQ